MPRIHTYYDNLKVARTATLEEIRASYKRLSQKHHPDRNPDNPEAARIMVLLNVAYQVLADPTKRANHDYWIKQQHASQKWQSTSTTQPAPESPPPPPPPPPRAQPARPKPRTQRRRRTQANRDTFSPNMRYVIRRVFNFLILFAIGLPYVSIYLISSIFFDASSPPQTVFVAQSAIIKPTPQPIEKSNSTTDQIDISGTYRFIKSKANHYDSEPFLYNKGKLIIKKIRHNRYKVLEARTIRDHGTRDYASIYSVDYKNTKTNTIELSNGGSGFITITGKNMKMHKLLINLNEISWWVYAPNGYSEKYLDRSIVEAERSYQIKLKHGFLRE